MSTDLGVPEIVMDPARGPHVQVLGTLRVTTEGGLPTAPARAQVRHVLALLVADAPRVTSADRLIEHLWPTSLPATPRKALNVVLSRTREELGEHADALVTTSHGYQLVGCTTDAEAFETTVGWARHQSKDSPADTVDQLLDALDSWSEPFAEDPDRELLAPARQRLIDLHDTAATIAIDLLQSLGRWSDLVSLAGSRHLTHPDDERVCLALVDGLGQLGRRSDALAAVARTVRALRFDLGIDPSLALLDVERRLIEQPEHAAPTPIVARPRRAPGQPLLDRSSLVDQLAEHAVSGNAVRLVGDAGVGKSSLLDLLEQRLVDHVAVRVAVRRQAERAFGPVADLVELILQSDVAVTDPLERLAVERVHPGTFGDVEQRLVTREDFLTSLTTLLAKAADVVIVDDVQWIDSTSKDVIERLVDHNEVAVVLATRPHLSGVSERFVSEPGRPATIEVPPLTRHEIEQLLAQRGATPPTHVLDEIERRSGGNSFFVDLLADRFVDGGAADELPTDALAAVARMLDQLSAAGRHCLAVAARVGDGCDVELIAELDPNAATELDRARSVGLITIDHNRVRFRHGIVAEVCSGLVSDTNAAELHRQVSGALSGRNATAIEVAPHALAAVELDPAAAMHAAMAAGGEFATGYAWTEARGWLEQALDIATDHHAGPDHLASILLRLGTVERRLGDRAYVERLTDAIDVAATCDDQDIVVAATVELAALGRTSTAGFENAEVAVLIDAALSLDVAPARRAELCAAAAAHFAATPRVADARALYHEALDLVSRLGDLELERSVLQAAHTGLGHPGDAARLRACGMRLGAIAGDDPDLRWESAFLRFGTAAVLGDPVEVQAMFFDMVELRTQSRQRPRDFGTAFSTAAYLQLRGDLDEADAAAGRALAVGLANYDESWALSVYALLMLGIRREQGRLPELRDALERFIDTAPDYLPYRAAGACVAVAAGDLPAAALHLDALVAHGLDAIPHDFHWTAVLVTASDAVVALGRDDLIAPFTEALVPFAGRMTWNGVSTIGAADMALAALAQAEGHAEEAARLERAGRQLRSRFATWLAPLSIDADGWAVSPQAATI